MSCSARAAPQILIGNTRPHSPSSKHQRRHSSSKPLSPPKNDPRAINAPSEAPTDQKVPAIESPKRSSTRLRRKNKDTVREPIARHHATRVNLPSVPSTQHLHPLGAPEDFPKITGFNNTDWYADIHIASFFSIHRPISVTKSIPPPSSDSAFAALFSERERLNHQPSDVIYTVSSTIHNIEELAAESQRNDGRREESDLRDAVTQSSTSNAELRSTEYLDGLQPQSRQINIQDLAKNFRPFNTPPPPVPMDQAQRAASHSQKPSPAQLRTIKKSYSTRLFITESIHPNGHTTYKTHTTPLREEPADEPSPDVKLPPASQQPFLKRMLERQRRVREWRDKGDRKEVWRSISVKRQRKLKMKKHKYKKLMRRTRNLRRKLDKT